MDPGSRILSSNVTFYQRVSETTKFLLSKQPVLMQVQLFGQVFRAVIGCIINIMVCVNTLYHLAKYHLEHILVGSPGTLFYSGEFWTIA